MRTFILLVFTAVFSLQAHSQCEITNLIAEPHPCVNGMFLVDIDFDVINPEGDTFGIVGNATNYGLFAYDSLPVTLGPLPGDGTTVWEFIVYDLEEPNCQAAFELGTVDCCAITDVVVDPTECQNMETFSAVVNFNFMNTGNVGFDVFDANENALGFFSYADLPVTVTGIPSVGNGFTNITICDNDNPDCCTTVEFEGLDCNPNDCEIWNVDVVADSCDNGQFFVTIGFNFENTGPGFTVMGNGNNYGAFSYDSLPIVIGPLEGNGTTIYEFVIQDVQNPDCSDFGVIGPIECPPGCGFNEFIVDLIECQSDSTYSFALNFNPVNPASDGFNVSSDGQFIGTFEYADLPVIINDFPASGNFFDVLTICDNLDSLCCATIEFEALLCGGCLIYDLVVEASACDSNAQFFVDIDFQFQNVGTMGFQVGGNGNNYGTFSYEDLPITLGPFDGDSTTFYEFVVLDNENGLCLAGTELGTIDCLTPCTIGELAVDPLECTGNGQYALWLDFDYVNTSNVGFDVFAGNEFVGFYLYSDLPVVVEHFPASGNANDVIMVCDNDNPDCCSLLEFPGLTCVDSCSIFEVNVDVDACTSDTTFGLYVSFETTGFTAGG
ncbi:MAG: hypothetical protein R3330_03300, partial [Saprospiraceae bacterium]|nr:hypothetical protein [Saprospiraceae bacterium]